MLSTLNLDPVEIVTEADPEARTPYLELAKDQIIRSAVILKYVLMDEFLSAVLCWHFFGQTTGARRLSGVLGVQAPALARAGLPISRESFGRDAGTRS